MSVKTESPRITVLASDWKDPRPERPPSYPPTLRLIRFGFRTLGRLFPRPAAKVAYRLFSTPRFRANHKSSDPVLESARIFEFLYGGRMLKGYEWGEGERTVLLVHGWESRGTALRSFVPALLEKGYRVIAFDGPAHGHSDGKRTNLPHFAGAVRAIMSLKGPFYATIGHSFGGASIVYALNFLNPGHSLEKMVQIGVPASIFKIFEDATNTLGLPRNVARAFKAFLETKAEGKTLEDLDLADVYSSIDVRKGLFVHDRNDHAVPLLAAEKGVARWSESELLITEGYGHFRLMKNPDVIQAVVRFLES